MIRVLLVHRSRLTVELLCTALDRESDLRVVGMATDTETALNLLDSSECDLVLVSVSFANNEALQIIRAIRHTHRDLHILVMGLPENPAVILSYLEAGASGFVLRTSGVPDLLHHIRLSIQNKALVTPEVAALLIEKVAQLSEKLAALSVDVSDYYELTPREKQVLDLIALGCTNKEIADALVIEVGTVKNHVHNILSKLNVHSRQDAALILSLIDDREQSKAGAGRASLRPR